MAIPITFVAITIGRARPEATEVRA